MRKYIAQVDQTRFARRISEEFLEIERNGHFATSILMTYFAPTDQLIVLNAGHPNPLWYRRTAKQWVFLHPGLAPASESARNLPLGVVENTEYVQFALQLEPGDLILAYTDALTESRDAPGELLGEDGLIRLAQSLDVDPPETLTDRLLELIAARQRGEPLTDDQTALLLHHTATDPPEQSIGEKLHVLGRMLGLPW
jgi:serine phosphatase RsbU (regulator of sigma subunit)